MQELDLDELEGHVVVCGWNASGPTVLVELFAAMPPTRCAVICTEEDTPPPVLPDDVPPDRVYVHSGDYTRVDVLEQVGVKQASSVILLADQLKPRSNQDCDARTVLAALTIERMSPGIYTVAELHSRQNEELLKMAGVEEIVVADFYAGMIIGSVQRNPGLTAVLDELLTLQKGQSFRSISVSDRWAGKSVRELRETLLNKRLTLIAVERAHKMVVNPDAAMSLEAPVKIVVLGEGDLPTI